jgi:hypothetical protein
MQAEFDQYVLRRFYDLQYRMKRLVEQTDFGYKSALGPFGATGPTGSRGTVGLMGASGVIGITGPMGSTGPSGGTGITGPRGATGINGINGSAGVRGFTGPTGITGSGTIGATGATGSSGATGSTGVAGPAGSTGATGAAGAAYSYASKTISTLNDVNNIALTRTSALHGDGETSTYTNKLPRGYAITIKGSFPMANYQDNNIPVNNLFDFTRWTSYSINTPSSCGPAMISFDSATGIFSYTAPKTIVIWECVIQISNTPHDAADPTLIVQLDRQFNGNWVSGRQMSIPLTVNASGCAVSTSRIFSNLEVGSLYTAARLKFSTMDMNSYPAEYSFDVTVTNSFFEKWM